MSEEWVLYKIVDVEDHKAYFDTNLIKIAVFIKINVSSHFMITHYLLTIEQLNNGFQQRLNGLFGWYFHIRPCRII